MRASFLIFSAFLSSNLNTCIFSTWDSRLIVVNQSKDKIYFLKDIEDKNQFYPELSRFYSSSIKEDTSFFVPLLSGYEQVVHSQSLWENSLGNEPNKILRIFIFSEDTILKYGAKRIFVEKRFLKRFDLTYKQLEDLNWKVAYSEN